ncbi:MAG TPA: hypothetical protein VI756_24000 [Blastocatellia bacterium]
MKYPEHPYPDPLPAGNRRQTKPWKVFVISLALAMLFCAGVGNVTKVAHGQSEPVWTDIMNLSGYSNMASGTFWQFSNLSGNGDMEVQNTDISTYPNLSIPGLSSGTPATGGGYQSVCSRTVNTPCQYMESNYGTGITGVGFLGTFGGQSIPGSDFGTNSYLFESVFFNEQYCFNGGREYGFFYDPYGNGIWVYWGTNENLSNVVQAQPQLTGVDPGTEYYYEMYPTVSGSSSGFQVTVLNTGYGTVYSNYISVDSDNYPSGSTITGTDPDFCSVVTSSSGESGHVTATTIYNPTISNIPSNINLNLQRVFVGKD